MKKVYFVKSLGFVYHLKKYANILTKFELLYRDTILFDMKSKTRDFLKRKLKDICFSTYSFGKVEKDLSEGKSLLKVNSY